MRLLTDALDMSRAEASMLTLESAPLSLGALCSDLNLLWRPRAEEKGLAFSVACDAGQADWIEADAMRLKQLLNNLIGNAIKFTGHGQVAVRLSVRTAAEGLRLIGVVEDSGPGVPDDAAATIFEPFNIGQADRSGAGAGLGLAICRQIAQRMGGDIRLDRSPAGGAMFSFEVQVARAEAVPASEGPTVEPTPHDTLHVLVADDNATNRFLAVKLLELFGCTADTVENGREAVEAVARAPYDLVLMDIKMPVMDGVEATRAIRNGPASQTPIIALTANADDRDAAAYRAAGMNGVVPKPIQPDVLLNAIRFALTPDEDRAAA